MHCTPSPSCALLEMYRNWLWCLVYEYEIISWALAQYVYIYTNQDKTNKSNSGPAGRGHCRHSSGHNHQHFSPAWQLDTFICCLKIIPSYWLEWFLVIGVCENTKKIPLCSGNWGYYHDQLQMHFPWKLKWPPNTDFISLILTKRVIRAQWGADSHIPVAL